MKILVITPYLYNSKIKAFSKNKTGFGILLDKNIRHISNKCEIFVFTNAITHGFKHYRANILSHTWFDLLFSFSLKDVLEGIKYAIKRKQKIRDRLLFIYYKINCSYLRKVIKKIKPDVIHCHGISEKLMFYVKTCVASGVPVVNTLHGLIGLSNSIKAYPEDKKSEFNYLLWAQKNSIATTVLSTGMLNRIKTIYKINDTNFITVILNGTDVQIKEKKIDIRKKYKILNNKKIIISVGNLCENKNQKQIVRSFALLPKEIQNNYVILLLGNIEKGYYIESEIIRYGLIDKIICCGFIDHNIISSYYSEADLNVLASKDEGFGNSILEGFVYGVPCVTFSDIDVIPDIYDERAMLLCSERTDEAFSDCIKLGLLKKWDREWICNYAKNFSLENIAKKYIELYSRIIAENEQNKYS